MGKVKKDRIVIINTDSGITFGSYDLDESQKALLDLTRLHESDTQYSKHPHHKIMIINAYWNEDGSYTFTKRGICNGK